MKTTTSAAAETLHPLHLFPLETHSEHEVRRQWMRHLAAGVDCDIRRSHHGGGIYFWQLFAC